jgi:hypothetical protein
MTTPTGRPIDCPEAPGFRANLQTLILHEACEIAGGISQLADRLRVSPVALARWLDGEEDAPDEIYQTCIEMVLQHEDPPKG